MDKSLIKKILTIALKSIGIIVFIIIIYKIGINKLWSAFSNIKFLPLFTTVVLSMFTNIIKAARWKIICAGYGYKIDNLFAIKTYLIGTFLGFLTPGRIGDFGRSYYLNKKEIPLKKALMTVLFDRICDLVFLLFFAFISIFYLQAKYTIFDFSLNNSHLFLGGTLVFIVISFVICFLMCKSDLLISIRNRIKEIYYTYIKINFNVKDHLFTAGSTMCALLIGYGLFYYLSYSLNIPIGFVDILAFAFVISFIQLIPITVMGIGTRDLTLLYFFKLNNIDPEWAVTLSMTVLLANILSVTPGMVLLLKEKYLT